LRVILALLSADPGRAPTHTILIIPGVCVRCDYLVAVHLPAQDHSHDPRRANENGNNQLLENADNHVARNATTAPHRNRAIDAQDEFEIGAFCKHRAIPDSALAGRYKCDCCASVNLGEGNVWYDESFTAWLAKLDLPR